MSYSSLPKVNTASDHESIHRKRSESVCWLPQDSLVLLCSPNLKVADLLDGRMNGPLKAWRHYLVMQGICPLGWARDGAARIHRSRHQGREVRHLWLLYLMTPLSKWLLPFSVMLNQIPFGFKKPKRGASVTICNWNPAGVPTESASLREGLSICFFFFFLTNFLIHLKLTKLQIHWWTFLAVTTG